MMKIGLYQFSLKYIIYRNTTYDNKILPLEFIHTVFEINTGRPTTDAQVPS